MVWKKTESKKKAKFIRKLKKKMDDGKAEGERREEEMKRIHEEERKKRREEMRVLEDTMRRELIMRQEHLTSFLLRLQGRKLVKRVTRYNLRYLVKPLTERSQTLPRTSKISPPTSGHSAIVSADGQIDSRRAPGGPCQCRGHLHSRHRLWVIGGVLPRLAPPPQGGWRT